MKRTYVLLASVLASAAGAVTVASAQRGLPSANASRVAVVGLRHTKLGKILVNSKGHTLYEFTRDHSNRSACATIMECPEFWPALKTTGKPVAGAGLRASLLSTIKLPGGAKQVTYAGHPLYTYSVDSGPGETSYVGERAFGGNWYAINASGHTVK
jgi:predicted lipoprotein with Yx(FWY)xxD motif